MPERPAERAELDLLLDPMIEFAEKMLRKHGEFYPFGVTMEHDGQVAFAAGDTGTEHPDPHAVIGLLVRGMRARATNGEIRASGICYDVRVTPPDGTKTDAIAMSVEHKAGDGALVFRPYSKGRFGGWKFGDLFAQAPDERRIFVEAPRGEP